MFREGNHVVDLLTKMAMIVDRNKLILWRTPSSDLKSLLQQDVIGHVWPRRVQDCN